MPNSESGHFPNRSYMDREGNLHLNGANIHTDEVGGTVSGSQLASAVSGGSGQSSTVTVRVDSATVIAVNDMVWLDTDDAKPASDYSWDTDLQTTQSGFAGVFLGVAKEASANGETDPIEVEIGSAALFEDYAVASGNYEIGDPLGPDENPSNTLANQTLEAATNTSAIARAMQYGTGVTELNVTFASSQFTGSSNVNAHVG